MTLVNEKVKPDASVLEFGPPSQGFKTMFYQGQSIYIKDLSHLSGFIKETGFSDAIRLICSKKRVFD